MKCRLDLKAFKRAFGKAAKASASNPPIVSMQSVLLDLTDPASPSIFSTDGEVGARISLAGAEVQSPGRLLMPRKLTDNILAAATGDVIEVESEGFKLVARAGRAVWPMSTFDPATFPDFLASPSDPAIVVDSGMLALAVRRTSYAAEREDGSRAALKGVCLEWGDGRLACVAADGFRLARQEVEVDVISDPDAGVNYLIPIKLASLLLSTIEDDSGPVEVSFPGNRMASFRFAGATIAGRMLEGRFPAWRDWLVGPMSHEYRLPSGLFRSTVAQAAAVESDETRCIDLAFGSGLLVATSGSEVASSRAEMAIEHSAPAVSLTIRSDHLLAALKATDSPEVRLALRGSDRPYTIGTDDGFDYHAVPLTPERKS